MGKQLRKYLVCYIYIHLSYDTSVSGHQQAGLYLVTIHPIHLLPVAGSAPSTQPPLPHPSGLALVVSDQGSHLPGGDQMLRILKLCLIDEILL